MMKNKNIHNKKNVTSVIFTYNCAPLPTKQKKKEKHLDNNFQKQKKKNISCILVFIKLFFFLKKNIQLSDYYIIILLE